MWDKMEDMEAADRPDEAVSHLSREEILEVTGMIEDAKLAAIEASGASMEELEEAAAWASGESDVMGNARHPLSSMVARLYNILTADEPYGDHRGQ